jgi:sulfur carrier protein
MLVELNGRSAELPDGATVADAIRATGAEAEPRGVAVALDGEVVRRVDWDATRVRSGQIIEVVRAVQGG